MARSKAELKGAQKGDQNRRRLNLREVLPDASARSCAEWKIAVAVTRFSRFRLKTAWIEPIRLTPQFRVTMNGVDGHADRRSGPYLLITELNVSPGLTHDQRSGRIKAHRFLDDLVRIRKRIDMLRMDRAALSDRSDLTVDPLLDLGMEA